VLVGVGDVGDADGGGGEGATRVGARCVTKVSAIENSEEEIEMDERMGSMRVEVVVASGDESGRGEEG
jgi:hypothetical protein